MSDEGPRAPSPERDERDEINRVAHLLMAAWERDERKPVSLSYVATFVDLARVVIADRDARVTALEVDLAVVRADRAALEEQLAIAQQAVDTTERAARAALRDAIDL